MMRNEEGMIDNFSRVPEWMKLRWLDSNKAEKLVLALEIR